MNSFPHIPVLLSPVLEAFKPCSLRVFIDGTLGAGGHASAILAEHPEIEHYIGIDQDPQALEIAAERLKPWKEKVRLNHGNFTSFPQILADMSLERVDGILVDLGVSSMQLDRPERGFSFMRDGPLDMRMNPDNDITAAAIVNHMSEKELGRIFREYGEESKWRLAARAIVEGRKGGFIDTTGKLADVLKPVLGHYSKKGIHPLTLVFQALRICVNGELEMLQSFLKTALEVLSPSGRLAVISFHSLEDRIVKTAMRLAADDKWDTVGCGGVFLDKEPTVDLLTRKPIVADESECKQNPRSRSAKLRVVKKK